MFQKEGREIQCLWVRIKLHLFQKENKLIVRLREFPCLSKSHHGGHSGETSQWSLLSLPPLTNLPTSHVLVGSILEFAPFVWSLQFFTKVHLQNSPGSLHLLLYALYASALPSLLFFFFYGAARKFFQEHSSIPVMPLLLMHWCLPTAPKIGSQVSFKSHVVILSWPMRTSPSYSGIMSSPPPHHHFALLVLAILCFVTHRLYSCLESYILCLLFQCLFPQIFILRSPEKMPEWPDRSIWSSPPPFLLLPLYPISSLWFLDGF